MAVTAPEVAKQGGNLLVARFALANTAPSRVVHAGLGCVVKPFSVVIYAAVEMQLAGNVGADVPAEFAAVLFGAPIPDKYSSTVDPLAALLVDELTE